MERSALEDFPKQLPSLLLAFLLVMLPATEQSCISELYSDGCSIPFNSSFPYRKVFRPACIRHDVCYYCGTLKKWSREECDKGFRRDMLAQCDLAVQEKRNLLEGRLNFYERDTQKNIERSVLSHPRIKRFRTMCEWTAQLYYWSVSRFAQSHYETKSPKWCTQPCAISQGIPNLRKYNMAVD